MEMNRPERIFTKEAIYNMDGSLWRTLKIDPKIFLTLRPFLVDVKNKNIEYFKLSENFFGDCYPYHFSDSDWIRETINNVRSTTDWSDDYMSKNPAKVVCAYKL
jgi:hypothetical protein